MINEIVIQNDHYFDDQIFKASIYMAQSVLADDLQYNTLEAILDPTVFSPTHFVPKGSSGLTTKAGESLKVLPFVRAGRTRPIQYKYGTETRVYHKGDLVGKFYLTEITRINKAQYKIRCVSAIGLLANSQHYGGIYSFGDFTAKEIIQDIIGNTIPYELSPELENVKVRGWLPIGTRRDNLHHLLFAIGGTVLLNYRGDPYIAPLSSEVHKKLSLNRFYLGLKVKRPETNIKISLVEHKYGPGDKRVTLFEGKVPNEKVVSPKNVVYWGSLVLFNSPTTDLQFNADSDVYAKILEQGANYVVLGHCEYCKLEGVPYRHTTKEITKIVNPTNTKSIGADENLITVSNETLVTDLNSEAVTTRLENYFGSSSIIDSKVEIRGELPGDALEFPAPGVPTEQGFLASTSFNLSNKLKASCKIVAGYVPPNPGNTYNEAVVITSSQTWKVPIGVKKIRVVLIGGGEGGHSGYPGQKGSGNGAYGQGATAGVGGNPGRGGQGGKIYIKTLNVTPNQPFNIVIGKGGVGGVCTKDGSGSGTAGEATTFGDMSSASGRYSSSGYSNVLYNKTYGTPGIVGKTKGGDGASKEHPRTYLIVDGRSYASGVQGKNVTAEGQDAQGNLWNATAYGGYGGGPAYGNVGWRGKVGEVMTSIEEGFAVGGDGGHGADASHPGDNGAVPGAGGQGGSGGGGAGGGGDANHSLWSGQTGRYQAGGFTGTPGLGSNGGNGADGCVIVYM